MYTVLVFWHDIVLFWRGSKNKEVKIDLYSILVFGSSQTQVSQAEVTLKVPATVRELLGVSSLCEFVTNAFRVHDCTSHFLLHGTNIMSLNIQVHCTDEILPEKTSKTYNIYFLFYVCTMYCKTTDFGSDSEDSHL